ncbi:MAG: hypothetical protein ACRCSO_10165 [Sphingomonas sp.]
MILMAAVLASMTGQEKSAPPEPINAQPLPTGHNMVSYKFNADGSIASCDVAADPFWQNIPKETACSAPNMAQNMARTFGISLDALRRGVFRTSALQDDAKLDIIEGYEYRKELGRVQFAVTPDGRLTNCKVILNQGFGRCDPSIETFVFSLPKDRRPGTLTFVWDVAASTKP